MACDYCTRILHTGEAKILVAFTAHELKGLIEDTCVKRTWKSCPVYVLGNKNDLPEIERRVHLIATDETRGQADMWSKYKGKLHEGLYLCSDAMLDRYIVLEPQYDRPVIGWLELNNGFFFSVDPSMTEKFAALFGLLIEIKTAQL